MTSFFVLWGLVACDSPAKKHGRSQVPAPELTSVIAFLSPPALQANPNPNVPLAFIATARPDRPCTIELMLESPDDSWAIDLLADGSQQAWPVVGLIPDTTYAVTFRAYTENGASPVVATTIQTPALPADFPVFEVLQSQPERMEPGYTLVSPSGPNNQGNAYISLVDDQGRVVWFYTTSRYAAEAHRNESGNLVFLNTRREVQEVDLLGNAIATWWPATSDFAPISHVGPAVPAFHHDVHPLPNGDLLGLSVEAHTIDDFPTSDTEPDAPTASARVAGDLIVQFDRTGTEVRRFSVLDMLDPQRVGYDALTSTYWDYLFGSNTKDWSHTNNVVHLPDLDHYIFSARNQDAVVEFDGMTGDVQWILAPPMNWSPEFEALLLEPVGMDFRYSYHAHGPEWTPDNTLLLFDNGTHGASAFEDKPLEETLRSRVVEFAIDREAMTVSQLWEYDPSLYASALGDADHLPKTGNVLAVFGTLDDGSDYGARIIEVTRTMPPEVVFELGVRKNPAGVLLEVRESDRIDNLYPSGNPQPRPLP